MSRCLWYLIYETQKFPSEINALRLINKHKQSNYIVAHPASSF